ncbi:ATP-binding protein [Prosthecobacter sp.]|uniref:sensor histidine kinase n=1 Tax=Prosthecobacter sp. TaxID=1965333 RepID=UPI002487934F|nr:ATP-binding protein [Prosthecobacter sp.]MDI1315597.1 ATP-binding protein [Prosthecobacter sp.]
MYSIVSRKKGELPGVEEERTARLYRISQRRNHILTDRLFAKLMVMQWLGGLVIAVWISPMAWNGSGIQPLWHVWAALCLGGAISAAPVLLAWRRPGRVVTRHVIAVTQILTSALLIHLTGGRFETHFHIFGSLTFLAFYRDWRVLVTATLVVAVDHFVRGIYWPLSIFGVMDAGQWRWLEHLGWVLIEDVFLMISIQQNLTETLEVAKRRSRLESINAHIENQVIERTAELTEAHKQLLMTSRQAGMAEVATNVLHNVGNVLNSVNVSAETVAKKVRHFRISSLKSVAQLLREHEHNLSDFLTKDSRGIELPSYLVQLADNLAEPQKVILEEVKRLQNNIEHIKQIVTMQQNHARVAGILETLDVVEIIEDAINISTASLTRHEVALVREFESVPPVVLDRHKVMPILVNLLSNATHALAQVGNDKQLKVRVALCGGGCVKIKVIDNGAGIAPENLTRIFQHGFTTRKDGHGFGLHSGALAAREIGGKLTADSDGIGRGAVFTLELPLSHLTTQPDEKNDR